MNMPYRLLLLAGWFYLATFARAEDKNFYVFLCFGQSTMEGFPGIPVQDKTDVDERFQVQSGIILAVTPTNPVTFSTTVPR